MGSGVSSTAKLYNEVHVIGSSVGDHAVISDNSDILRSTIAPFVEVGRRNLVLDSSIGEGSYTGSNDVISNASIGKYCSISWNVGLGGGNHNYRAACMFTDHYWRKVFGVETDSRDAGKGGKCVIENGVWVAQAVSVVSGVTVGDGAVIGANATVLSDIPPFAVAVGTPARVVKYRFEKPVIDRLLRIAWWEWDREKIKRCHALLSGDLDEEMICELEKMMDE